MTAAPPAPVRVWLPRASPDLPAYCACCLSAVEGAQTRVPLARGLAIPWCEDCTHHAAMRRVDRFAYWGLRVAWGLVAASLSLSLVTSGRRQLLLRVTAATLVFFGLGLLGLSRVRFQERREACRSTGRRPVRVVGADASGWTLELSSPEFGELLLEANPAARRS